MEDGQVNPQPQPATGPPQTVEQVFASAQRLQQAGKPDQAAALYRRILQTRPDHAASLHFLGVAAFQQGRGDEAMSLLERSLELAPDDLTFNRNMAGILQASGRQEQARLFHRKLARLDPDGFEAHLSAGEELLTAGNAQEAARRLSRAAALQPASHDAWNLLGCALGRLGQNEEAVEALGRAVRLAPHRAEVHSNLGAALLGAGRLDQAVQSLRRALELDPNCPDACCNMGAVLRRLGRLPEALHALRRAVELQGDNFQAHYLLGLVLWEQEELEAAEEALTRAVKINPGHAEARLSLGRVLRQQGKIKEALAAYDRALAEEPSCADGHFSRGLVLLQAGRFAEGWQEYEWGWASGVRTPRRQFDVPRWDGQDLAGRTLLLSHEQGLGDVLQFCRYAPLAAQRGGQVLLECPKPLIRLLSGSDLAGRVVEYGSPLGEFDLHCPLMSVPGVLGTTLESIPCRMPYLKAAPAIVQEWAGRLGAATGLRVGLVWGGNPLTKTARQKAVPLEMLRPLLRTPGTAFYSLHVERSDQDRLAMAELNVRDLAESLTDFAETAGAVANLDLVICVDTAVAHLAGAMARGVWVMLPFAADWRWLISREDSPWYPTMRLFRQDRPGDWAPVIRRVAAALKREPRSAPRSPDIPHAP